MLQDQYNSCLNRYYDYSIFFTRKLEDQCAYKSVKITQCAFSRLTNHPLISLLR